MAKVAKQWLVWQSDQRFDPAGQPVRTVLGDPTFERIVVALDAVVPDTVPLEVQKDWEERDLVFEDPTKESVAKHEGPPQALLPPVMAQRVEHMRRGVGSRGIPPRPKDV